MPTAGPNSPSTVVSDASAGGAVSWANPGNAVASDDSRAVAAGLISNYSEYLKATGFGFAIPTGSTILGITVEVEKRYSSVGPNDRHRRLVKAGIVQATDGGSVAWTASDAYATYGGPADLWGDTWTAADVNDSGFGFALSVQGATGTAEVDHVRISVTYLAPSPPPPTVAGAPFCPGWVAD